VAHFHRTLSPADWFFFSFVCFIQIFLHKKRTLFDWHIVYGQLYISPWRWRTKYFQDLPNTDDIFIRIARQARVAYPITADAFIIAVRLLATSNIKIQGGTSRKVGINAS
jgi:hypothetical protein